MNRRLLKGSCGKRKTVADGNPKSEIRNPKEIRRAKHEDPGSAWISGFGIRASFGFRISDFGFALALRLAIAAGWFLHLTFLHAQLLPPPRGNVLLYDADPFAIESAMLLGGFNVPDWASVPTGLPSALTVTSERASANGLGTPTSVPLAPLPAGTVFALANQLAPDIAIFNYSGRAGVPGDADGN